MRSLRFLLALTLALPTLTLAAVPGDNGRIALVAGDPAGVAVVNPDGSGLRPLLADAVDPAFSPDGTRVAFVRDGRLLAADATGANEVELAGADGVVYSRPAWSPDGTLLAVARATAAAPDLADIYVLHADGTGLASLVESEGDDTAPAWSPDGTKLAFETTRDGNREIYVVDADGSNPVNLTNEAADDSDPDYAPDGSEIVFVRGAPSALLTMAPDGSGVAVLLGVDGLDLAAPAWSPDGSALALTGAGSVWTVAADGTGLVELAAGDRPAWQPVGEGLPPLPDAGEDQAVECSGPDGATVLLDGSASTDPDDAIALHEWYLDFGVEDEVFLGEGATLEAVLTVGTHVVTLQAIDAAGHAAVATVTVEVHDTVPPEISVRLNPSVIWPANHKMVPVHAIVQAVDLCGPVTVVLDSVTSSEPDDATGDGNTRPDIQGAEPGTDDRDFMVRAERRGNGPGRTYTAAYTATDASGNAAQTLGTALVPHDNSGKSKPGRPPARRKGNR